MTDKPTMPTPANTWRKAREEGELIKLPGSGNIARLVRPPLSSLVLANGGAPNPLSRAVQRLLAGSAPPKDESERWENYKKNIRAMQEIAVLCLAEPRLVLDRVPGDDEIGPDDLAEQDYIFIVYSWVEGAIENVAPFRVAPGA